MLAAATRATRSATKACRIGRTALASRVPVASVAVRSLCTPAAPAFDPASYYHKPQNDATKDFIFQQTMIRVKDPAVSLQFYTDVLGFQLVCHRDFPQWGFSVYFVAYCDPGDVPTDADEQFEFCMRSPACLEVTWNHGSEQEADDRLYNTGNSDTTGTEDGSKVRGGFGHIGVTVPDVYAACERFKSLGVEFTKTPNAGGMKGLAFIKDPDGYLIEVLPQGQITSQPIDCDGIGDDSGDQYKDNSK